MRLHVGRQRLHHLFGAATHRRRVVVVTRQPVHGSTPLDGRVHYNGPVSDGRVHSAAAASFAVVLTHRKSLLVGQQPAALLPAAAGPRRLRPFHRVGRLPSNRRDEMGSTRQRLQYLYLAIIDDHQLQWHKPSAAASSLSCCVLGLRQPRDDMWAKHQTAGGSSL